MGSSQSRQIQAVGTLVTNTAFSAITNNENSCKMTTTINQTQGLKISGSHNKVTGYDQGAYLNLSSNCTVSSDTNQQMVANIAAMLQNQVSDNSSALGDTLKSLVTVLGGNLKSQTSVETTIQTNVSQLFTVNNTNEMVSTYVANQSQSVDISGSYNELSNITQALQLSALMSIVSNNTTLSSAVASVSAQSNSSAQSKSVGPIEEVLGGVAGVLSAFGGNWGLLGAVGISACACVCLAIIIFVMFKGASGGGGE